MAILGDGGVGKTALAVQVCLSFHSRSRSPRGLVIADLNISLVYAQLLRRSVSFIPITARFLNPSLGAVVAK